MAKKPTRLRFTEEDLADGKVKKAADRAEKGPYRGEEDPPGFVSWKKSVKSLFWQ